MDDFALIDDNLANSQRDIGESSNLAQIAQTYACNFDDKKYIDYVCILSVLAQVAIDNAKRRFDINLTDEIRRIKNDMGIKQHKYPAFWSIIKRGFNWKNINHGLKCPMNKLYDLRLDQFHPDTSTLPMSDFFIKHKLEDDKRICKLVEELIQKYSLNVYDYNTDDNESEEYLLLRSDYDELINDISNRYISKNYKGLFSWFIDRAFRISPRVKANEKSINSLLDKNKSLLLKTLYDVNSICFLSCFKYGGVNY